MRNPTPTPSSPNTLALNPFNHLPSLDLTGDRTGNRKEDRAEGLSQAEQDDDLFGQELLRQQDRLSARDINRQIRAERKALNEKDSASRRGYATGLGVLTRVQKAHPQDPKAQIAMFFREYTIKAGTGRARPVSERTSSVYADTLIRVVDDLRVCRAAIKNLGELGKTHVLALIKHWAAQGQSAATLQNKISVLRRYLTIIGKEHAVARGAALRTWLNQQGVQAHTQRQTVARVSKAWDEKQVDFREVLAKLQDISPITAIQLEVQAAFGLRMKESIQLNPKAADYGDILRVVHGTKGGLPRDVGFDPDPDIRAWQRDVLERAKLMAEPNRKGTLSSPGKRLDQSKAHFYYQVRKVGITQDQLGVTAHGLRHQYAARRYQQLTGFGAPVSATAPHHINDAIRQADLMARGIVSRDLGHFRVDVPQAYLGSLNLLDKARQQRIKDWLQKTEENPNFVQALKECGVTHAWLGGRYAQGLEVDEKENLRLIVAKGQRQPMSSTQRAQLKTWLHDIYQRGIDLSEHLELGSPDDALELQLR